MSIYWRNGVAWGRKEIKGVTYRRSLGVRSKREAESAYTKWVANLTDATGTPGKDASFAVAVRTFTDHHLGRLKKSSQVRYLQSLLNLAAHFDGKTLREIGRADLSNYVSDRRKSGVSDPTIIRDLACLSSVYTIASDFELVDVNPVLPFLRAQKRRQALINSDSRKRYLSHAEELAILTYAADLARSDTSIRRREKWMIAAALAAYIDTGMRAQELLAMQWAWIDAVRQEINIPADNAKGAKARSVPILGRLARILKLMPRNTHTDLVFWRTKSGRGFDDLNHTLQRYAGEVGVTGLTVHDLRRTCGCRLLQDHKASMEVTSKWLGHASVVTTEKIYAFLKVENLHDAVGTVRNSVDLRPQLNAVLLAGPPETSGKTVTQGVTAKNNTLILEDKKRTG